MRSKLFAVLAGLVICMMAVPAQAKDRRHHNRRPLISVSIHSRYDGCYNRYDCRRGIPIWTGLQGWGDEMYTNLDLWGQRYHMDICQRHLKRVGWDEAADSHCPLAGISYDDYLEHRRRNGPAYDVPEDRDRPEYSEPSRPEVRESDRDTNEPMPADTGELWLNGTGCPMKINGTDVPPEGLHVQDPGNASVSVLSKKTCRATDRREVAPGIFLIVCR